MTDRPRLAPLDTERTLAPSGGSSLDLPTPTLNTSQSAPNLPRIITEQDIELGKQQVRKVRAFADAPQAFVDRMAERLQTQTLSAGAIIVRAGVRGVNMYFIRDGHVDVKDPNGRVLTTLKPGDMFGEISVLSGGRTTATCIARTAVQLSFIAKSDIDDTLQDFPALQSALKAIADKRLAGDAVRNEGWDRMQTRAYIYWVNSILAERNVRVPKTATLENAFENGINLIHLAELLTKQTSKRKWAQNARVHAQKIDNVNVALELFGAAMGSAPGIAPASFVTGERKYILGFLWTLFETFVLRPINLRENVMLDAVSADPLLDWCRAATKGYEHIKIENYGDAWQSGLAFCALIHRAEPTLLEYATLNPDTPLENLRLAFTTASERLGVPELLDTGDMVAMAPDQTVVRMYLVLLYIKLSPKLPDLKLETTPSEPTPVIAEKPRVRRGTIASERSEPPTPSGAAPQLDMDLRRQLDEALLTIAKLQKQKADLEARLKAANEKGDGDTAKMLELHRELDELLEKNRALNQALLDGEAKWKSEKAAMEQYLSEAVGRRRSQQLNLDEAYGSKRKSEMDLEEARRIGRETEAKLRAALEKLKTTEENLSKRESELKQETSSATETCEGRCVALNAQKAEMEKRFNERIAKLEGERKGVADELAQSEKRLEQSMAECRQLERRLIDAVNAGDKLNDQLSEVVAMNEQERREKRELATAAEALRTRNNEEIEREHELERDLAAANNKLARTQREYQELVDKYDAMQQKASESERKRSGSVSTANQLQRQLEGAQDEVRRAQDAAARQLRDAEVAAESERLALSQRLTEAMEARVSEVDQSRQAEIDQLRKQLADLEARARSERATASGREALHTSQSAEAQRSLAALQKQLAETEAARAALDKELNERVQVERIASESKLQQLLAERDELNRRVAEESVARSKAESQAEHEKAAAAKAAADVKAAEDARTSAVAQRETNQRESESARQVLLAEKERVVAELAAAQKQALKDRETAEATRLAGAKQVETLQASLDESKADATRRQKALDQANAELAKLKADLEREGGSAQSTRAALQAEKERANKLESERNRARLEQEKTKARLEQVQNDMESTNLQLEALSEAENRATTELDQAKADAERERGSAARAQEEVSRLREQNSRLSAELERLRTESAKDKELCERAQSQLARMRSMLHIEQSTVAAAQEDIGLLHDEINSAHVSVAAAEASVRQAEEETAQEKAARAQAEAEAARLRKELEAANARGAELAAQLEALRQTQAETAAALTQRQSDVRRLEEVSELLRTEHAQDREALARGEAELKRARAAETATAVELARCQAEQAAERDEHTRRRAEMEALEADLKRERETAVRLMVDLERSRTEHARAAEDAAQTDAELERARANEEQLRTNLESTAAQLAEMEGTMRDLQGRQLVEKTELLNAAQERSAALAKEVSESRSHQLQLADAEEERDQLRQQLADAKAAQAASDERAAAERKEAADRTTQLEQQVASLTKQHDEAVAQVASTQALLERSTAAATVAAAAAAAAATALEQRIQQQAEELARARANTAARDETIKAMQAAHAKELLELRQQLAAETESKDAALTALAAERAKSQASQATAAQQLAALEAQLAALKSTDQQRAATGSVLQEQLQAAAVNAAQLRAAASAQQAEVRRLNEELLRERGESARAQEEAAAKVDALQSQQSRTATELAQARAENATLTSAAAAAEGAAARLQSQVAREAEAAKTWREESMSGREDLAACRRELAAERLERRRVQGEQATENAKLSEQLMEERRGRGFAEEELARVQRAVANDTTAAREIQRLRDEIEQGNASQRASQAEVDKLKSENTKSQAALALARAAAEGAAAELEAEREAAASKNREDARRQQAEGTRLREQLQQAQRELEEEQQKAARTEGDLQREKSRAQQQQKSDQAEATRLRDELTAQTADAARYQTEASGLRTQMAALQEARARVVNELEAERSAAAAASRALEAERDARTRLQSEAARHASETEQLQSEAVRARGQIEALQKELQGEREATRVARGETVQAQEEASREKIGAAKDLASKTVALEFERAAGAAAAERVKALTTQHQALESELSELRENACRAAHESKQASRTRDEHAQLAADTARLLGLAQAASAALTSERDTLQTQLLALQRDLHQHKLNSAETTAALETQLGEARRASERMRVEREEEKRALEADRKALQQETEAARVDFTALLDELERERALVRQQMVEWTRRSEQMSATLAEETLILEAYKNGLNAPDARDAVSIAVRPLAEQISALQRENAELRLQVAEAQLATEKAEHAADNSMRRADVSTTETQTAEEDVPSTTTSTAETRLAAEQTYVPSPQLEARLDQLAHLTAQNAQLLARLAGDASPISPRNVLQTAPTASAAPPTESRDLMVAEAEAANPASTGPLPASSPVVEQRREEAMMVMAATPLLSGMGNERGTPPTLPPPPPPQGVPPPLPPPPPAFSPVVDAPIRRLDFAGEAAPEREGLLRELEAARSELAELREAQSAMSDGLWIISGLDELRQFVDRVVDAAADVDASEAPNVFDLSGEHPDIMAAYGDLCDACVRLADEVARARRRLAVQQASMESLNAVLSHTGVAPGGASGHSEGQSGPESDALLKRAYSLLNAESDEDDGTAVAASPVAPSTMPLTGLGSPAPAHDVTASAGPAASDDDSADAVALVTLHPVENKENTRVADPADREHVKFAADAGGDNTAAGDPRDLARLLATYKPGGAAPSALLAPPAAANGRTVGGDCTQCAGMRAKLHAATAELAIIRASWIKYREDMGTDIDVSA